MHLILHLQLHLYLPLYLSLYPYIVYPCLNLYLYLHMPLYICIYTDAYLYLFVCTFVCISIYLYLHIASINGTSSACLQPTATTTIFGSSCCATKQMLQCRYEQHILSHLAARALARVRWLTEIQKLKKEGLFPLTCLNFSQL